MPRLPDPEVQTGKMLSGPSLLPAPTWSCGTFMMDLQLI
jgi:hypothetical protein